MLRNLEWCAGEEVAAADARPVRQREVTILRFDFGLERSEFENGCGFVVVRLADGQHLRWQTLPRGEGLESVNVVGERYRLETLQDPHSGEPGPARCGWLRTARAVRRSASSRAVCPPLTVSCLTVS
jgi:hypothetical protein